MRITRSTAAAGLRVLLVCVFGSTAILQVRIPDRLRAVVKTYDGYEPTVDRVHKPSTRTVDVVGSSDLSRRCGRFDVSVVVDRCDCREGTHRGLRDRVRTDYGMSVYVVRGRAYFSAVAMNGSRAARPAALRAGERVPHYGPVPVSRWSSPVDGKSAVDVIPEKTFKEWAQQEVASAGHQEYLWNRSRMPAAVAADTSSTEPFWDDREIQVTFSGRTVRFARDACLNFSEYGLLPEFSSDRLTVNRGGCVLAFDDERCAGAAPRIVVQEPGYLYSTHTDRDDRANTAAVVKSITGCCGRGELDLEPRPTEPFIINNSDNLYCDCGGDNIAWAGEPVAARGSYLKPFAAAAGEQARPADERQLLRLFQLNADARAAMETAKRAAVSVATEGTLAGRMASVVAATDAMRTVSAIGNRSMEILAAVRRDEPRTLSFLEAAVQSADRDVRRAVAATPETAATLVMAAAQTTTCVPAFMASSYDDVVFTAAATNGSARPDDDEARRKLLEIAEAEEQEKRRGEPYGRAAAAEIEQLMVLSKPDA